MFSLFIIANMKGKVFRIWRNLFSYILRLSFPPNRIKLLLLFSSNFQDFFSFRFLINWPFFWGYFLRQRWQVTSDTFPGEIWRKFTSLEAFVCHRRNTEVNKELQRRFKCFQKFYLAKKSFQWPSAMTKLQQERHDDHQVLPALADQARTMKAL